MSLSLEMPNSFFGFSKMIIITQIATIALPAILMASFLTRGPFAVIENRAFTISASTCVYAVGHPLSSRLDGSWKLGDDDLSTDRWFGTHRRSHRKHFVVGAQCLGHCVRYRDRPCLLRGDRLSRIHLVWLGKALRGNGPPSFSAPCSLESPTASYSNPSLPRLLA